MPTDTPVLAPSRTVTLAAAPNISSWHGHRPDVVAPLIRWAETNHPDIMILTETPGWEEMFGRHTDRLPRLIGCHAAWCFSRPSLGTGITILGWLDHDLNPTEREPKAEYTGFELQTADGPLTIMVYSPDYRRPVDERRRTFDRLCRRRAHEDHPTLFYGHLPGIKGGTRFHAAVGSEQFEQVATCELSGDDRISTASPTMVNLFEVILPDTTPTT